VSNVRVSASCLVALALFGGSLVISSTAAHADRVRDACASDYHRFCSQYSPGSSQTRACMQANGRSLSGSCVNALIDAGVIPRPRGRR
jgi:hypothetical protein